MTDGRHLPDKHLDTFSREELLAHRGLPASNGEGPLRVAPVADEVAVEEVVATRPPTAPDTPACLSCGQPTPSPTRRYCSPRCAGKAGARASRARATAEQVAGGEPNERPDRLDQLMALASLPDVEGVDLAGGLRLTRRPVPRCGGDGP
jgi:hypothetical protein